MSIADVISRPSHNSRPHRQPDSRFHSQQEVAEKDDCVQSCMGMPNKPVADTDRIQHHTQRQVSEHGLRSTHPAVPLTQGDAGTELSESHLQPTPEIDAAQELKGTIQVAEKAVTHLLRDFTASSELSAKIANLLCPSPIPLTFPTPTRTSSGELSVQSSGELEDEDMELSDQKCCRSLRLQQEYTPHPPQEFHGPKSALSPNRGSATLLIVTKVIPVLSPAPNGGDHFAPCPTPPTPHSRQNVNPRRLLTKATLVAPIPPVETAPTSKATSTDEQLSSKLLDILAAVMADLRRLAIVDGPPLVSTISVGTETTAFPMQTTGTELSNTAQPAEISKSQIVSELPLVVLQEVPPLRNPLGCTPQEASNLQSFKSTLQPVLASPSVEIITPAAEGLPHTVLPPNPANPLQEGTGRRDEGFAASQRRSVVGVSVYAIRDLCATDCSGFRAIRLSPPPQGAAAPPLWASAGLGIVAADESADSVTPHDTCPRFELPHTPSVPHSCATTDLETGHPARPPPAGISSLSMEGRPSSRLHRAQPASRNVSDLESFYGSQLQRFESTIEMELQFQSAKVAIAVSQLQGTVVVDDSGCAVLCQFEILAELGKGNFGKVSLVVDAEGELYALKTLHGSAVLARSVTKPLNSINAGPLNEDPKLRVSVDSGTLERSSVDLVKNQQRAAFIEREIAVMKLLNHPNIVKLHAVILDPEEGQTHLVMQYVDNGPIGKIARDNTCRPLPFTLALKYMVQVARGFEYLHSQGIIHRDIKPENILIRSDDTAYVADFGVSSIISEDNLRTMAGTLTFFSPELLATHSALDQFGKESDVWAFGVTLFCLLFGKLPFTGHTGPALMRSILLEDLVIPDYFPEIKQDMVNCSDLLPDSCPFICRHLDDLRDMHRRGPIKVPSSIKELLQGLLHRDPTQRFTLPQFRQSQVVRRILRVTGHQSAGTAPPVDALTLVSPDPAVVGCITPPALEVRSDEQPTAYPSSRPDSNPLREVDLMRETGEVRRRSAFTEECPFPETLSAPTDTCNDSAERSADTAPWRSHAPSGANLIDVITTKEIEQAITHCNIILRRARPPTAAGGAPGSPQLGSNPSFIPPRCLLPAAEESTTTPDADPTLSFVGVPFQCSSTAQSSTSSGHSLFVQRYRDIQNGA